MEVRELICISCPLGCTMMVSIDGENVQAAGNGCQRGAVYAKKEILHPTRIVTSSVPVEHGMIAMVAVKTKNDIPKEKISDVMREIGQISVQAPINIGDVIIANCAGTGVSIVATRNVAVRE